MASSSEPSSPESPGSNRDNADISKLKVGDSIATAKNGKTSRNTDDSDQEYIPPQYLMKVEVSEGDEAIEPDQYKDERIGPPPKKKPCKKVEPFICNLCFLEFTSKSNLKRHAEVHKGDLRCPICSVPMKSQNYLAKHMSQVHQKTYNEDIDQNGSLGSTPPFGEVTGLDGKPINRLFQRHELTYSVQNAIVSKMHKGRPVPDICQLYNTSPEVVNEIWNDKDQFLVPKNMGRWSVKHMNRVVEPLVLAWYNAEKDKYTMTGRIMQNAADRIAKENGFVHFNAGNKWLEHFKRRNNIYLNKKRRVYNNSSAESKWIIKFFEEQWSELRKQYVDDDIYCADEVGFYYNVCPTRIRKLGGKKFIHGDACDRLAVLLCTNMSGSDKKKLLVCGSEDPLFRSYRKASTLPVDYKRNSEGHFTTEIFENYIHTWNGELEKDNKQALLLLDRASIHTKLKLANLQLVFLPWKGGSALMAIKNGIFGRFRSEFRNLLLETKVMNVSRGVDRNLTCLEGIEMIQKAWERVPATVITKSFLETGYEVQNVDSLDNHDDADSKGEELISILKDYDMPFYFGDLSSLDMYLTVDDEVLIAKGTNPSVFGGNHKKMEPVPEKDIVKVSQSAVTLPLNTEIPENNEKELLLRKTKAIADLEIVRKHLQSNKTSYETYCHFMNVEKAVIENFVKLNNS